MDLSTEFLFGSSVNSLQAPIDPPHQRQTFEPPPSGSTSTKAHTNSKFSPAFKEAQTIGMARIQMGHMWPLFEMFENKMLKTMKVINGYTAPIIEEAMKRKHGAEQRQDDKISETLLDHLLSVSNDPKFIKDQLLNMLLAGRDSTASTLTFVIYLLSLHPHVCHKLRAEILDIVGDRIPSLDDLHRLVYLRAVIDETLRLFPPIPYNIRDTAQPAIWTMKDGTKHYIPAKSHCAFSVLLMQRDPEYWGPDADHFDPERFIDERSKNINPFSFLPFNIGPRICLGQQFAYNEIAFFLVRFLQIYDRFTLRPDAQPEGTTVPLDWSQSSTISRKAIEKLYMKTDIVLSAHGGMWISIKEAVAE